MKLWEDRPMPERERQGLTYVAMALWVGLLAYNVSHVQEHLGQASIQVHGWRNWALSAGPDILVGAGIWKLRYRARESVAWLMLVGGAAWLAWAALSTCAPTWSGRGIALAPIVVVGLVTASIEFRHSVESTLAIESIESIGSIGSIESTQSSGVVDRAVEQSTRAVADESVESIDRAAVESGPVESSNPAPAARVVELHSVPTQQALAIKGGADPAVVEAIKAAVEREDMAWPVKIEPMRQHLKIGVPKIKAAVKELQDQGWSPREDDEQAVGE